MADLQRILIQLDAGPHASCFDSIVAIDSGADRLLTFNRVEPQAVQEIVHGAMFTRGGDQLKRTAIFVGGSDVQQAEALFAEVTNTFFGPVRVSVMLDPNGANTTAVAAVQTARRHLHLEAVTAVVLAGTGPVGQRVARLLCRAGAQVRVASRKAERAAAVCDRLTEQLQGSPTATQPMPVQTSDPGETATALANCDLLIAAGAAGRQLVSEVTWGEANDLQVVIDLNAVPPAGVEAVAMADKGTSRHGKLSYGAIGVGGLKMKIHQACLTRLFTTNDLVLDADEIMTIGGEVDTK